MLINTSFVNVISINLFWCCEKVLSIWIHRWLKKFNETSKVNMTISMFEAIQYIQLMYFENFWNMGLEIDKFKPTRYLSWPRLAWKAALKKTEVKSELLNNVDMLLIVKKGIRCRLFHNIHWYSKANYNYMKDYDKNKEIIES